MERSKAQEEAALNETFQGYKVVSHNCTSRVGAT